MNINISKRLAISTCAALCCLSAFAQGQTKVTGKVVDKNGNPIPGASIIVEGTTTGTVADADGNYSINVPAGKSLFVSFLGYKAEDVVLSEGVTDYKVVLSIDAPESEFLNQKIDVGAFTNFSRSESTAAVSVITNKNVDKRSAKNINNSIIGQGNGLVALDGTGTYYEKNPTFFVRGLQSLNETAPLILVDGIERDIKTIAPQDVEEVQILKDAAAVALYGYKGANNAILIKTKRGANESTSIKLAYEHLFNFQVDRPKFVDGVTYAKARNEALALEGKDAEFSDDDIKAFESGKYPYYYPNVDWISETFRDMGSTNRYNVEFRGGGKRFRYFTNLNLLADDGFIKNEDVNYGYRTQDMYSRGNLRNNIDVKLTDYTDLQINIAGIISECSRPGDQANLWDKIYDLPALAFPVKTENDVWGGTAQWKGDLNPVANATGAAYYKWQERGLFTDISVDQSLETFLEGLRIHGRLAYDTYSEMYEDHHKAYRYGKTLTSFKDGELVIGDKYEDGVDGEMATGANTKTYRRRGDLFAGVSYDRQINDDNHIFAQVRWDYDFTDTEANHSTLYRENISWYSHYGLMNKYFLDIALDASACNRLAPDHKWAFSPTVSAAWVVSNEDFLASSSVVNFLKLRASYGAITTDWIPGGIWEYWTQSYSTGSAWYPLGSDYQYGQSASRVEYGRMAALDPKNEKALKLNVGIDARLFNALDVELDWYRQRNVNAWVEGAGAYSAIIGFGAPYVNDGETLSTGFEASLDFNKSFGDVAVNIGGTFNFNKNEIVSMAEEFRLYPNLVRTGDPLKSTYGLIAEGLFKDQADIDNSPTHTFTTVRPGDIKYKDVNEDGIIDANDECKIGYSTTAPEIVYSFHLGAEFKGIGFDANFQGVGHYSTMLNTKGYYHGLFDNRNLSQELYDGRWTPENLNAEYPRLCASANDNNFRNSTFWLRDRSYLKLRNVELYYDFKNILEGKKVIHGAKLFVRGVDLFTKDKLDNVDAAQHGAAAPLTRSVAVGCSLTF